MKILQSVASVSKRGANRVQNFVKNHQGVLRSAMVVLMVATVGAAMAQTSSGQAGSQAFTSVTADLKAYIPLIRNLCYGLAGIVAIVGSISVYIAMNNEEQDVKKKIMMVVGACVFLIAAATYLPKFFGL
ncbi:DUF4134 domain-containing protein [Prevotella histicola]|nr:DUF4134 domain-containing protein [Prevotella histicola]